MKLPAILQSRSGRQQRERGVTMVLVALAMIAIIAMAALSIDVVTLYRARQEAQRAADAAALTAARIISLSGLTGDPANSTLNWSAICGGVSSPASQAAATASAQNGVGGLAGTVTVTYSAGSGGTTTSNTDCSQLSTTAFGVNPMVTVKLTRASLPTFFSRIWGNTGNTVSATATAEAFNPSNSGNVGNQVTGTIIPVQPRCVKPWIVPNMDPLNPVGCTATSTPPCTAFVGLTDGSIQHQGISLNGTSATGVIGETFWLVADCQHNPTKCNLRTTSGGAAVQPQANFNNGSGFIQLPPNLLYAPGQIGTPVVGVPSCTQGGAFEEAIEGCDAPTNYQCGVQNANVADLTLNPARETSDGVACLIQQTDRTTVNVSTGQDSLNPFKAPSAYPFQILAGTNTPLGKAGLSGSAVTSSPSIVSLPIYDNTNPPGGNSNLQSNVTNNVTFVGFLQVFINAVDNNGNVLVTVLNVAGCGNGTNTTGTAVAGSSPVPVRLITPP